MQFTSNCRCVFVVVLTLCMKIGDDPAICPGIVVSTLAEAAFFGGGSFGDVLYAVPLCPSKVPAVLELISSGRCRRLQVLVDHDCVVGKLASAAAGAGFVVPCFVKVDTGARARNTTRCTACAHPRTHYQSVILDSLSCFLFLSLSLSLSACLSLINDLCLAIPETLSPSGPVSGELLFHPSLCSDGDTHFLCSCELARLLNSVSAQGITARESTLVLPRLRPLS